jgi:hypothetical protein
MTEEKESAMVGAPKLGVMPIRAKTKKAEPSLVCNVICDSTNNRDPFEQAQ